jgi:hypothetical protein
METSNEPYQTGVQISANSRKIYVHAFLRFSRTDPAALSGMEYIINNVCFNEMLHDKLKLKIWSKHQRQLQGVSCMTVPIPILLSTLLNTPAADL